MRAIKAGKVVGDGTTQERRVLPRMSDLFSGALMPEFEELFLGSEPRLVAGLLGQLRDDGGLSACGQRMIPVQAIFGGYRERTES